MAAPLPNRLIHVHGAAFTLWMVLLVVQTALISAKKVRWHKTLGIGGMALAVAMVVLGVLAAIDQLKRVSGPPGLPPNTFFAVPMTAVAYFAVVVFLAYRARYRPAAHKRLILIATIAISGAAVARWPVAVLQAKPQMRVLVTLGLLLLVAGYDLLSLRRVQKTTLWAGLSALVVQMGAVPLGFSPPWQAFARLIGGKS